MNSVIVGAYWGDEGKGKIVDLLAADADWVVRYNGGDNAGHTIVVGDRKIVLHILPSGVLQGKNVAIGPDVFFNPIQFLKDYQAVLDNGFRITGRVLIDERAHVIMPYHVAADASQETHGSTKIGTTKRGIGPVAKDKASRTEDLAVFDLVSNDLRSRILSILKSKQDDLVSLGIIKNRAEIESYADKLAAEYSIYAEKIRPFVGSVVYELSSAIHSGKTVIMEGAQGTLLDIVHGTRPFVTSSNSTAGGAFANIGLNAKLFKIIGIVKAYPTRVGEGLFVTELKTELGAQIQKEGGEFGATTGRPRKVGMPDFVALRYSAMVNGIDEWAVTKIDVLAGKRFKAAVAYERDGKRTERFPFRLDRFLPVYGREYFFESFSEEQALHYVKNGYDSLPQGMKDYFMDLVKFTGAPIGLISMSPKRDITVVKDVLERTRGYLKDE